ELRGREVYGGNAGADHREMDRGLTAAACNFQDRLAGNGFSQDLQFTLGRHRRAPDDVTLELGVMAGLVLLARRVPVVAVRLREGSVFGHHGRHPLLAFQPSPTSLAELRAH